jgi:hypothetical protein
VIQFSTIHFCDCSFSLYTTEKLMNTLVFFFLETSFSLRGEVNFQNTPYQSAKNSGLIHDLPLCNTEICVWCAISAHCDILTISGQELQRINNVLHQYTECIRSEGPHFWASTVTMVSFYLTFYRLSSQRIFFLLPSVTVKTSWESANNVTLMECWTCPYCSSS